GASCGDFRSRGHWSTSWSRVPQESASIPQDFESRMEACAPRGGAADVALRRHSYSGVGANTSLLAVTTFQRPRPKLHPPKRRGPDAASFTRARLVDPPSASPELHPGRPIVWQARTLGIVPPERRRNGRTSSVPEQASS